MLGDLLDDLDKGDGIDLSAVQEAGQQQAEERRVEERPQLRLGQTALLLDAVAQVLEQGPERAGPLERAAPLVRVRQSTPNSKILPVPIEKPVVTTNPYSPGGSGALGFTR